MVRRIDVKDVGRMFGKNVQQVRFEKNLTQRQLAARLGFGQSTISQLERGYHCPTLATAILYARALGVPLSRLTLGIDDA